MHKPYPWSPWQDEAIIAGYRGKKRGANKALAARWGVLPTLVSERARQLGCQPLIPRVVKQYSSIGWSDAEKQIVAAAQTLSAREVVGLLVQAGYKQRTVAAINSARLRLRKTEALLSRRDALADQELLTVPDICAGLGCSSFQVRRWIAKGKLRAQPIGGNKEYVVTRQALNRFLRNQISSWDHRAADRWFLVDILTDPGKSRHPKPGRPRCHLQPPSPKPPLHENLRPERSRRTAPHEPGRATDESQGG